MADRAEKILVEFDYDNIILVDPNKVLDDNDKVQERYVKQENLVMYANLECSVIPRTKLAFGAGIGSTIQTISIASINFLNPGGKTFLDNRYTDEITGSGTLQGLGDNQIFQTSIPSPSLQKNAKPDDYYIQQTIRSGGEPHPTDNGLLGITSITVKQNLSFMPTITIELEDVKGRALFEAGSNSPYAAFFNLPYPLFNLTLKGYYGKAIKLPIMLQSFTSRFDTTKGNFYINLVFFTYKYTVLSEISMAALAATPHMYPTKLKIETTKDTSSQFKSVDNITAERGYQKIIELYQAYKSKGLIPDDFPELTLVQLLNKLELFVKNVLDTFVKQNLEPLNNVTDYQNTLIEYQSKVFYYVGSGGFGSWFDQYMDKQNFLVLNGGRGRVYTYKASIDTVQKKSDAFSDLNQKYIKEYNAKLAANKTFGVNGGYQINGKTVSCYIPNPISGDTFVFGNFSKVDIDYKETYRQRKNLKEPTTLDEATLAKELQINEIFNTSEYIRPDGTKTFVNNYFQFEGKGNFIDLTNKMLTDLKAYKEQIETALTEALSTLLQDKNSGIGFVPSIRNILAIIFANGEGFLRLMDEVHTKAWTQRDNVKRKSVIFNDTIKSASADAPEDFKNTPVYPWPQFINHTNGIDGHEKFELAYPGDPDLINQTQGYLYDVWPEVEFVEEFINGLSQRDNPPHNPEPKFNEVTQPQRVTVDAIEFPINNQVYQNKQLVKFMYEIWERLYLVSNYSKLSRVENTTRYTDKITNLIAECENINISKSLSNNDVDIIQNLKNYGINANNFLEILRHFSNEGVGQSWVNLTLGIFNTPYIKNLSENGSFQFIDSKFLLNSDSQPIVSLNSENNIKEYIGDSSTSNYFDFTDLYPFTDINWDRKYLANGQSLQKSTDMFKTSSVLNFNSDNKIISNFLTTTNTDLNRPITNFNYKNIVAPTTYVDDLKTFYETRSINFKEQLPTEGNIRYNNYVGLVNEYQTTSIFNTPYFINSIQVGVQKNIQLEKYPFVASAYLFLNSLPLSTLREKYKSFENDAAKDLDYIASTLKKFGAVHKMPYPWILKMGSIWHRYKNFYETGTDILSTSWSGFNYSYNYDPISGDTTKKYTIVTDDEVKDIVLQRNDMTGTTGSTYINTGFYPKLINDFSYFYLGHQVFDNYDSLTISAQIVTNGININYVDNAVINYGAGTDIDNPDRTITITPWWVTVDSTDNQFMYILPSQGSLINQTNNECFVDGNLIFEVTGNTSMYNGSVRLFWEAPNYGYFDSNKLNIPPITDYMKVIFSGSSEQENFSINGDNFEYARISEIFSVFEKDILDKFENEFLNFSRSAVDYDNSISSISNVADVFLDQQGELTTDNSTKRLKNFQTLFRELMNVPKVSGQDGTDVVKQVQQSQTINIQNLLTGFLTYDVVFKYGNPSNFNKKLFYSFSNLKETNPEPYTWSNYTTTTPDYLPTPTNGVDYFTSVILHTQEWITLYQYVGFSEIPELDYFNPNSYITAFFIDNNVAFTVGNIQAFAPIIKIYATQKLKDPTLDSTKFFNLMTEYLALNTKFQDEITNNLIIKLQKSLPNVDTTVEKKVLSELLGNQSKVELWESFKSINDKWISGLDLKNKTLFEDVMLVDRASRNVGEKVLVDIYKLKDELLNINPKSSMLTFVQSILVENHFFVMNIPSYINFYNVQEATKNPIPKFDGTAEFAYTLFGTHLNVDYRNSTSKMVCFYGGKPSEQLAIKNTDYRYRDDSFDLRKPSDNPLVENLIGKKDWDKSNRVVGFNVDIGPQNQSIFNGFTVSQDAGLATAESLEIINQMANLSSNRKTSTQSVSLYNLYKNRSYKCSVTMMGNVMIQPTMYFNLRNVPMFSGPYMITQVDHSIKPGSFDTYIQGIRQPTASLPKIDDYLQSLKTNLLQTILDQNKKDTVVNTNKETINATTANSNVDTQKQIVQSDATSKKSQTISPSQTCLPVIEYTKWVPQTVPITNLSTYQEAVQTIMTQLTSKGIPDDGKLKYAVFTALYLASDTSSNLTTQFNNYAGIKVNEYWGDTSPYLTGKYYCGTNQVPYAVFNSLSDSIGFLMDRWKDRTQYSIKTNSKEDITKFWILNFSSKILPENVYTSYDPTQLSNLQNKVEIAIKTMNNILGITTKETPPVPVQPQPSPFTLTDFTNTDNGFLAMKVDLNNNSGTYNMFLVEYTSRTSSECGANGDGDFNQYISPNKQSFSITRDEILIELGCSGQPIDVKKGSYQIDIVIYVNPTSGSGQQLFQKRLTFTI